MNRPSRKKAPTHRRLAVALAASILVMLLLLSAEPSPAERRTTPPNVVIILVDDLGWAEIGRRSFRPMAFLAPRPLGKHPNQLMRHPLQDALDLGNRGVQDPREALHGHTPHIDSMLERGIELTQYLTHTRCSPSRAGLLTGRHYTRVGSGPEVLGTLHLHVSNIARDLQDAGFATAAFGKWPNSYPNFPPDGNGAVVATREETDPSNDRFENFKKIPWGTGVNSYGFDEWKGFYGGAVDYFDRMSRWDNDTNWWTNGRYTPHVTGYTVDIVAADAVDFMSRHRDNPFFCYVAMPAPHNPLHILKSDLETIAGLVPGSWKSIRSLTSPTTGRRIDQVVELRCGPGEEFDHTRLDPSGTGFARLARATFVYAMDRGIGEILSAIDDLGLSEQTVVWFASDNGGLAGGGSYPFRGAKGTFYEGGIRVPAAVLWQGTLDAQTVGYADGNTYPHVIQYLDIYPTTMSMVGSVPSSADLDGRDGFGALLSRTPIRPPHEASFVSFDRKWATIRSEEWKLLYNEAGSAQARELYALPGDPLETVNVFSDQPDIADRLIGELHGFMSQRRLSMSYFAPRTEGIFDLQPHPHGEILEVRATQTEGIEDIDQCGLFVRFASAGITDYSRNQLESGDVFSFDIRVAEDSALATGFYATRAHGSTPVYGHRTGVNHTGRLLVEEIWPRGEWVRAIAGIGERAPIAQPTDYIALGSSKSGTAHFFLDNVVILRSDGSPRAIVWESSRDTVRLTYRYCGSNYDDWESVSAVPGFPFSELSIRVVN
jgi:arylsulfatase A-like enzyme